MKIIFNIRYRTNWGESVYIVGDVDALGGGDYNKAIKLKLDGNDRWSAAIETPVKEGGISYHYFVRSDEGAVKDEWGKGNRLLAAEEGSYRVYDRWQDQPFDKPFYSSLFTECVYRQNYHDGIETPTRGFTLFEVAAPMAGGDNVVAICGSCDNLGNWDPARAIRLSNFSYPVWQGNVPSEGLDADTEYKFLILNRHTGEVVAWEGGANRRLGVSANVTDATVLSGMRFINNMALWKGAGTAIPVFALRSF